MPTATHEVTAYPLMWPPAKARTPSYERKPKRWGHTLQRSMANLRDECAAAGIHDYAISLGRQPGVARDWNDVGAVLWFMQEIGGKWYMAFYASDGYRDGPENVKAIAMTIQRLRQVEDYGVYTAEQAMRGAAYDMLPPPNQAPPERDWWDVLGVAPTTPAVVVEAAYKALAKQRHPDRPGGSNEAMAELQRAFEQAKAVAG